MKDLLIFFAGAAAGAFGVLMWLRKDYNDKLDDLKAQADDIQRQHDELEKRLKKDESKDKIDISGGDSDVTKTTKKPEKRDYSKMSKASKNNYQIDPREAPSDASESSVSGFYDEDEELVNGELDTTTWPHEGVQSEPYDITIKDFVDNVDAYDKVTLMYYVNDGVLAEEDGTVIENVTYTLGDKWKDAIGKQEDDVAYIRNERVGTDYEVVCEHVSYADEFGVDD